MRSLIISRHSAAIFFAVLLGVMTGLPQLLAVSSMGPEFQGIYPVENNDELYYLARGQEVVDGHGTIGQPYLFEGKDAPSPQFWLAEFLIGKAAATLGVSIHTMFTALDFVLPAIAFLLSYLLALSFVSRPSLALLFAAAFHFGIYFEEFNRPVSPQFNFIVLQLFLLAALRWIEKTSRMNTILLGATFGLLFSVYAYYAIYAALFFVAATLITILRRDTLRFRGLVQAGSIAFVLALPYVFQLLAGLGTGLYAETMQRLGMIETHFPSGVFIVSLAGAAFLALCAAFYFRITTMTSRTIMLGVAVAVVPVATNLHVVTGSNLEFSSHYDILAVFTALLLVVYLAEFVLRKYWPEEVQKKIAIALLLVFSAWSFVSAGNIAIAQSTASPELFSAQRYGPLFRWATGNTERDAVFFANKQISSLLPSYTHVNVYYAREANMHYASDDEVERRYVASEYFSSHVDGETIRDNERLIWGTYYTNRRQHAAQVNKLLNALGLDVHEVEQLPETEIVRILADIKRQHERDFREVLGPYRADYIIWDRREDPTWEPEIQVLGLTKLFDENDIVVYRL